MTPLVLHTIIRDADAQTSDADLLARFVDSRDEAAFEQLVQRHGPLVWTVCRQVLPHYADAEDAFQAVFLALIQGAGRVRFGQALPSWLYGVAIRVAKKSRRSAGRRKLREARSAAQEQDQPVPDAAWSALMAAVHEEIQQLPEAERAAFILCELEGLRQPDAATRLGWPLGTLSGRLCKARRRLIDQLTQRGVIPSVLIVGSLAVTTGAVPAALAAKVAAFPHNLKEISSSVAALAHGLLGVASMRNKILTMALLVAGAVGLTASSVILSNVSAQSDSKEQPGAPGRVAGTQPGSGAGRPGSGAGQPGPGGPSMGPASANREAVGTFQSGNLLGVPPAPGLPAGVAVSWDYKFIDLKSEDRDTFEKEIRTAGSQGWEFCGSERLRKGNEGVQLVLVFKKSHTDVAGPRPPAVPPLPLTPPGPRGEYRVDPARPNMGAGSPDAGTPAETRKITVIKLKNLDAALLATVVQKVFKQAEITAEPATNQLIVRASAEQANEIHKLVEELEMDVKKIK